MGTFKLPDVGEGLTEAEIVTWHVAVGDEVAVNQVLVDIETAKSIVELPSPYAGTVKALLVEEGQTVDVGTPIITVGGGDEPEPAAAEPAEKREPVLVGYGVRTAAVTRRRRRTDATPAPVTDAASAPPAPPAAPAPARPLRVLAKPPVRKLAKDHGIDLAEVPCDGPVVTRADVEAFLAARREPAPTAPAPAASAPGDVRVPVKGVRKATAEAMVASAFTAPHVTEWITLDVSATMDLVQRLRADRRFADVKVSPTVLVARAVCLALRRTPELNASWDEASREIVLKGAVNLGIAAATDRGLVVPVVRDAQDMDLHALASALGELTATARAGRTQPAEMSGGTFTITNIGVFGVDGGTPILNPGESGILAVGSIERRPWVDADDQVVARWVTTLALSFDHRVVDGEQGSRFLADVAAILRDPSLALTY